jgi:nucleotide-binding universal stress UspA family protein
MERSDPDAGPVLVASDLSEAADEAIRQAHRWAASAGRQLHALVVIPGTMRLNPLFPQLNQQDSTDFVAAERAAAEQLTERIESCVGDGEAVPTYVDFGDPYAVIVRKAEEIGASLVVVGGSGATGLARVFLGSVAEKVVRHTHCSVLVARAVSKASLVLAATDLSDPALIAVRLAALEAILRGLPLAVMYNLDLWPSVVPSLGLLGPIQQQPDAETLVAEKQSAREVLRTQLERIGVKAKLEVTADNDTTAAIVKTADILHASLVVIGSRGGAGIVRMALGTVAEQVVRYAHCSVMVARND